MFNQLHYTSKIFFYYYNTFFIKCKTVILRTGFEPVRYWIQSPVPYQLGYLRWNALWRNWTHNLSVRSRTLYPVELRVLVYNIIHLFIRKVGRSTGFEPAIDGFTVRCVFPFSPRTPKWFWNLCGVWFHDVPDDHSSMISIDSSKRELSPSKWRWISTYISTKNFKNFTSRSAVATVSGYLSNPSITVYDFRLRRE